MLTWTLKKDFDADYLLRFGSLCNDYKYRTMIIRKKKTIIKALSNLGSLYNGGECGSVIKYLIIWMEMFHRFESHSSHILCKNFARPR